MTEPTPSGSDFEREKWLADLQLRKRELDLKDREQQNRDADLELRRKEHAVSAWRSPLTVAVLAAAAAALGNALVTVVNGNLQRDLEGRKRDAEIALERSKAESNRILEMIKTGDTEKAAGNLDFLLNSGLVTDPVLTSKLRDFLKNRAPGSGPTLPSPTGRVEFEKSEVLTPKIRDELQKQYDQYVVYLQHIGFPPTTPRAKVRIEALNAPNAYYSEGEIVIDRKMADDPSVPLREYNNHVLSSLHPGASWTMKQYSAVESGLADYFACSFLENPRLGERSASLFGLKTPYIRTLSNSRTFNDLRRSRPEQYPYTGAEVWGGAFWRMRQKLGRETADPMIAAAWLSFALPGEDGAIAAAFVASLLEQAKARGAAPLAAVSRVLKDAHFPSGG